MKKISSIIIVSVLLFACKKNNEEVGALAVVYIDSVFRITPDSAFVRSEATFDGLSLITAKGICYSTTSNNPTLEHAHTNEGANVGSFISKIGGLSENQICYLRAYATNGFGTAYGNVKKIVAGVVPTVSIAQLKDLKDTSVVVSVAILNNGSSAVNYKGICWSKTSNPTLSDNVITDASSTAAFEIEAHKLLPNTKYYFKAFARNNTGIHFSEVVSVTTMQ